MVTPPHRYRRDTDTDEAPAPAVSAVCPSCNYADPDPRSRHYLSVARAEGIEGLRAHIHTQFVSLRDHGKQRPDIVDDICTWVGDLRKLYENLAHPETGAPLTWQQARTFYASQRDAIDTAAFTRAPAGYTWKPGSLQTWIKEAMEQHEPGGRMREPGEDDID